ncbi:reverse transcriptase domain-containing protein [Tanacetum coccineum]
MAAHTERMERFKNAIFKQSEEINDRMTKMFGFLKELTTSMAPEKHMGNEKLIEGLVDNHMFNDTLSGARVRKLKGKTYNLSPTGPVYDAILKKDNKERGHRRKLRNTLSAETNIRLSLVSHSYIYLFGIAEDILVEVAAHVYPVDFVILDIKEDEKRPFILGTPFLTTAKAIIKFDKGTITLRSRKIISNWMAFRGNTRDLGSFGEEKDEIMDLHQILEEVLLTERGDGIASIK